MKWVSRSLLILWLASLMAACSTAAPLSSGATPLATPAPATALAASTLPASTKKPAPGFPHCNGMLLLSEPVQFDWPNLAEHKQDFSRSQWTYYSCDQSASKVASMYRQDLPRSPYSMDETNWLVLQEGTLGVYFSQTGAWDYIWFVPQPDDTQKSYVIVAETFAYVECF